MSTYEIQKSNFAILQRFKTSLRTSSGPAERLISRLSDPAGNEVRLRMSNMFPDLPFETQRHILSANLSAFTDNHHVFLREWELPQHRDFRQVLPELDHC